MKTRGRREWSLRAALVLAALCVPTAALADPPPAAPPPASPAPATPEPPKATPPTAAQPPEDPPYDAAQHGGLSYGAWIRATRGTGRRSTGMLVTGSILVGLGITLLATGTGIYAAGDKCNINLVVPLGGSSSSDLLPCGPRTAHTTGMAILGTGVVGLGIGIPLTVLGAEEVPRAEAGRLAPSQGSPDGGGVARNLDRKPPPPYVSLALSLTPALRGAGIALHF